MAVSVDRGSIILGIVSIVSLPPASPNQATLHRLCDAGRRGSDDGNDRHPQDHTSNPGPQDSHTQTKPSIVRQLRPSNSLDGLEAAVFLSCGLVLAG